FILLLYAHWDACALYLSARIKHFDHDRSWVGRLGIRHRMLSVQYFYALFKALSHMLCIGYGTLSAPVSVTEVWLTTISMTLGASLFAAIIGSITALFL
ncbi:hypothetical protein M885DRAFT_420819, partial [Pelagophyceae sp. CCMP2097]